MKKITVSAFLTLIILSLFHCKPNSQDENLTPVLDSISPTSKVSHLPGFTLKASGSNFNTGSLIVFNGIQQPTGYVNTRELTCRIDTEDITLNSLIAHPGDNITSASSNVVSVLVRNPSPAGDSNALDFTITENPTFIEPVNITNHSRGYINDFDIEAHGTGNVYLSYMSDQRGEGQFNIFLRISANYGSNWSQGMEVPVNPAYDYYDMALNPAGNINMVWRNWTYPEGMGIFLSRSNNGTAWTNALQIYLQGTPIGEACITSDQAGNLYVVFEEYLGDLDFFSLKSTCSSDNGLNWSLPVELFNREVTNKRFPPHVSPSIATDNKGSVYAFWYNFIYPPSEFAVYFCRSDDMGVTWSQPGKILGLRNYEPYYIAVDREGNINVLWSENTLESMHRMYLRRFTHRGDTPGEIITFYPGGETRYEELRAMAVDSAGNIDILYTALTQEDVTGLLFSRSTDNGQTWSPPVEIPVSNEMELFKMAVDDAGNIYIAIFFYGMDAADIYFSKSN